MATEQEIADLNAELLPLNQAVRGNDDDGYELCNLVPSKKIEDIVEFGLVYNVTITP